MAVGVGLAILSTIMVSFVAVSKKASVIIMPSTVNEYAIVRGRVPDQYLIDMTRDIANLLLNRHPNDTDYFRDNILRRVEPRYHDAIRAQIAQDEIDNKYKAGERTWRPDQICVLRRDDKALVSEVVGVLDTYVNDRKVDTEFVVKRFEWTLDGMRLWLVDTEDLTRDKSECINMKGDY